MTLDPRDVERRIRLAQRPTPQPLSRDDVTGIAQSEAEDAVETGFSDRSFAEAVEFEDEDDQVRITITNGSVTEGMKIQGSIRRADGMTDKTIYSWSYLDVVDGQFNLIVNRIIDPALLPGGLDEEIEFTYFLIG